MASHLYLDRKYLNIISSRLQRFVWKSTDVANCRCPICGDSKKKTFKARGFFYTKKNVLFYKCHNCGVGMRFSTFLKQFDGKVYKEYLFEHYKEGGTISKQVDKNVAKELKARPVFYQTIPLDSIASLRLEHYARSYIAGRKIPQQFWNEIYYAPDYKKFVDSFISGHGKELRENEARIVIPFYDKDKTLLGFTGRSLESGDAKKRYITLKVKEDEKKVFGLERFNKTKNAYVVEGVFDSLFIENCLAATDSNLLGVCGLVMKDRTTLVWDNEKRNKDIIRCMAKAIDESWAVFIWPDTIQEKDINDCILAGYTQSEVEDFLRKNTYSGMQAKLRLLGWRK